MSAAPSAAPRRALLLALTLAFPWLLLGLVELGLRVGGYGGDYPLFARFDGAPGYLLSAPDAARRYFRGAFVPTPHTDFFREEKPANGFRVFFQGESSAQGFPYLHGAAPSRMLERWLEARLPGREVEVVNTAFTAVSSYVLLDQADQVIAQRPDAVLIYTGHNEYYGVFGAGAAGRVGRSPGLVRLYLALRRLRLVQLTENVFGGGAGPDRGDAPAAAPNGGPNADAPRSVMALMSGDQHVPLGSARFEAGVAQFRSNLGALLAKYRSAGVPVFVGTLVSNERDQPPFVSEGADRADAHYARARALEAGGDTAAARPEYQAAKDGDALRFRAPEAMNRVIREEAARYGATVVESQAAVERASPGGVPGATLILEHLHPNVAGYAVIARAFYDALAASPALRPAFAAGGAPPNTADVPVTAVDSAVGALRTDRLRAGWPFQPRGVTRTAAVDTLRPRTAVEALAQAVVLGQTPWPEATDRLRAEYAARGDTAAAIATARVMAQEYRYSPQPWLDAAGLALAAGQAGDALAYATRANRRRETPDGLRLAGLALFRAGDRAGALPLLDRAAGLAPGDQRLAFTAKAARALPVLESGPAPGAGPAGGRGDATRLYNLAVAYALLGENGRAREALAQFRRAAPGDPRAADLAQRVPGA